MHHLWAPWRSAYVLGEEQPPPGGCIFCDKPARGSEHYAKELILGATDDVGVMLNAYPYNSGHVMVFPRAHVSSPEELPPAAQDVLFRSVTAAATALRRALSPDGINVGMNLGRVAGAGIEQHCHVHLVPRWNGDTNFMPVLAATKVISQHLEASYAALLPHFSAVAAGATDPSRHGP